MKRNTTFLTLYILLLYVSSSAQPGSPDMSFGKNGKVITAFDDFSFALAMALQPDGRIVVAGDYYNGLNYDFAITRYDSNGSPDWSFGKGGKVITDFSGQSNSATSVAIQRDGKLIVAGNSGYNFALARYNADGSLDCSFGTGGKVITTFNPDYGYAFELAIQTDGRIVVAGDTYEKNHFEFALARYNTDGTPDNGFGANGKVTTNVSKGDDRAQALALQKDGKIVVAGAADLDIALVRYMPNGSLDNSFGVNGIVITDFGNSESAVGVAIQQNGKIVIVGTESKKNTFNDMLVRYESNGNIDYHFGINGKATSRFTGDQNGNSLVIQPDGKIVTGGTMGNSQLSETNFALARYNETGIRDETFGNKGKVVTDFDRDDDAGQAVAIQRDGKILLAGGVNGPGGFEIARYNGDAAGNNSNNISGMQALKNYGMQSHHLFPNPVKDILYVSSLSTSPKTISIADIKGNVFQQIKTSGNNYSFNVKQLKAGTYFLKIEEGKQISTMKFIKQ